MRGEWEESSEEEEKRKREGGVDGEVWVLEEGVRFVVVLGRWKSEGRVGKVKGGASLLMVWR